MQMGFGGLLKIVVRFLGEIRMILRMIKFGLRMIWLVTLVRRFIVGQCWIFNFSITENLVRPDWSCMWRGGMIYGLYRCVLCVAITILVCITVAEKTPVVMIRSS